MRCAGRMVMGVKCRIAWDVSHLEFTIEDHYYFSRLKARIVARGGLVEEVGRIDDAFDYDTLVLNYPEQPFTPREVELVERFVERGGRVVAAGYYRNEDRVADNVNTVASVFGLALRDDGVEDQVHNHEGDPLLVVTDRIARYGLGVDRVLLPCTASVTATAPEAEAVVMATASGGGAVLAAEARRGRGSFVLLGTCVFWDNFSIDRYGNGVFAMNLLFPEP